MRGGRFRFAGIQALVLGVVTVVVATFYDLPVRDPDGADVKTYVRLPVILLLAFLVDVAPRALARRPSPADLPRALMAVVRERWTAAQIRFALVGLGAWYLTYVAFRNRKSYVPFVNDRLYDERAAVLADPSGTDAVQTIAAFASLHVAVTVTACLCAELMELPRWTRTALWTFLVLTVASTVYLGWHYFTDAIGGAVIGTAGVLVGAWVTGNHGNGVPPRILRTERQSASAARMRAA